MCPCSWGGWNYQLFGESGQVSETIRGLSIGLHMQQSGKAEGQKATHCSLTTAPWDLMLQGIFKRMQLMKQPFTGPGLSTVETWFLAYLNKSLLIKTTDRKQSGSKTLSMPWGWQEGPPATELMEGFRVHTNLNPAESTPLLATEFPALVIWLDNCMPHPQISSGRWQRISRKAESKQAYALPATQTINLCYRMTCQAKLQHHGHDQWLSFKQPVHAIG